MDILTGKKNREINALLGGGDGVLSRRRVVCKVKFVLEKTLTMTRHFRFVFVYAEHLSNVIAVYLKIGQHAELVKALHRHQQNEGYGSDPFHKGKCN